jgi:ribonuclease J
MLVRDNAHFRDIMSSFDKQESLILYSMWDGYRTDPKSTIPNFLNIIGNWQPLHTSGHASLEGLQWLIHSVKPNAIIPIHTDNPEQLSTLFPNQRTIILNDGETFHL